MLESWQNGDFWVCFAVRKSWTFDMVYWAKNDRRFFRGGNLDDRFNLLTTEEQDALDDLIKRKLAEEKDRTL